MQKFRLLSILFFMSVYMCQGYWWDNYDLKTISVTKVPVADMLLNVASYYTSAMPKALYKELPLSCEPTGFPCVRVHQMLFNELLFDVVCINQECSGKIPNAFYGYNSLKNQPLNTYCSLASTLIPLSELAGNNVSYKNLLKYIPAPINSAYKSVGVLTLSLPWRDPHTGILFSVGTRFVRAAKHDRADSCAVRYIRFDTLKPVSAFIPRDHCLLPNQCKPQELRTCLIALIRLWINHAAPKVIPYVLGGSSYLSGVADTRPQLTKQSILGQKAAIYKRKETRKRFGFDCSELIWRISQMFGLDYPWKSSMSAERFLKPLAKGQHVHAGDLIWVPGHIMIVSDVKNDLLIEAVGYKSGFGKVHEIALKDRIEHCSTYSQLVSLHHARTGIKFIGGKGSRCVDEPCKFKILKLPV